MPQSPTTYTPEELQNLLLPSAAKPTPLNSLPPREYSGIPYKFYGQNALAYESREPEILLAGAGGTGKSIVLLAKCLTLLDYYPGCRGLFCRGTRSSMTQTGLVTWEEKVLGLDHPVLRDRPITRRVRDCYRFDNGSEFVVAGLDDAGKTLSSEYDFVYIQEATEEGILLGVYETLMRSLRNGRMPFAQIMSDCNPTSPEHWLYQRQLTGTLKMYTSYHRDNPGMWDREKAAWTEEGEKYMVFLKRMSGSRLNRFLYGVWKVATGLVYDYRPEPEYDELTGELLHPGHIISREAIRPEWKRVWGIDWGLSSPTVLGIYAVDEVGRMYHTRERFQTHLRPDVLGKWAKNLIQDGKEPIPEAIVCDHDDKNRRQFEESSGLALMLADKSERDRGIETMQARFDLQDDHRPAIFFVKDALDHPPDEVLVDSSTPASTLAELGAYTWDEDRKKDSPIMCNDHGLDLMRYVSRYVDSNMMPVAPSGVKAARDPFSRLGKNTFR